MNPNHRIVTSMPLTELWDQDGLLDYVRSQDLSAETIRNRLRSGPLQFVVADCGHPLEWIAIANCFDFWKDVVKARIISPQSVGTRLEDFPDQHAFMASEWRSTADDLVLLETMH